MTAYVPPDFLPIGMVPVSWVQGQFFMSFSGLLDEPATGIALAYAGSGPEDPSRDPRRLIVQTQGLVPGGGKETETELAFSAMHLLVNALGPSGRPEGDKDARVAQERIQELAAMPVGWHDVRWTINGQRIEGRSRSYGTAWGGFAVVDEIRGVVMAGSNAVNESIVLHDLDNAVGFVFDFHSSHTVDELEQSQPVWAGKGLGSFLS